MLNDAGVSGSWGCCLDLQNGVRKASRNGFFLLLDLDKQQAMILNSTRAQPSGPDTS